MSKMGQNERIQLKKLHVLQNDYEHNVHDNNYKINLYRASGHLINHISAFFPKIAEHATCGHCNGLCFLFVLFHINSLRNVYN
jgi:hypothetical protein